MSEEAEEVTPLVRDAQQLLSDLQAGAKTLVGITDVGDLVTHLKDQMWPALEALAEQALANANDNDELENSVLEIAEGEGEMLTPETAGMFANLLLSAEEIVAELEKRLGAGDNEWKLKCKGFKILLKTANEAVAELTVGELDDQEGE